MLRQQCWRWNAVAAIVFAALAWSVWPLVAEETIAWKTGDDFRRQLRQPVGFSWQENPIRAALGNLSRNRQLAIWLDRRVDPGVPLDLSVEGISLHDALRRIAASVGCVVSYPGPIAYIGPRDATAKLATIAALRRQDVTRLPEPIRMRFELRDVWQWDELSSPRELLQQLCQRAGIKLVNLERIPHDLWPAADLPALSLTDRITLVLAGFDLTFEIARDGSAIRPMPMPAEAQLERTYPLRSTNRGIARKLAETLPAATLSRDGKQLTVTGSWEDHETVAAALRGERPTGKQVAEGETRFDLRVSNEAVGAIVKVLAEHEKLTVKVDPAIQANLQQRVSFDLKQAKLEEVLEQALKPVGIAFQLKAGTLELRPRRP